MFNNGDIVMFVQWPPDPADTTKNLSRLLNTGIENKFIYKRLHNETFLYYENNIVWRTIIPNRIESCIVLANNYWKPVQKLLP